MRGRATLSLASAALVMSGAAAQAPPAEDSVAEQSAAEAARDAALASRDAAQSARDAAQAELDAAQAELDAAQEELDAAQAALRTVLEPGSPQPPQGGPAQSAAEDADEPPYTVDCRPEDGTTVCYTDRATYVGWRTFHGVCHTCHAQDAVGSTFAPALLPRIRQIDKARFVEVLDEGFTGQMGVMPAWNTNPNVNRYYEELWSYLRARADGELLPGRPTRLPD